MTKEGPGQHSTDRAGNTQGNRTNIYSDYQEISPWNAKYIQEYKVVDKPFYRYIMGTMSDFHHYLQKFPITLVFFAFFRSVGMFYGISNPFMGLCGLAAALCDSWYNFVFLSWSVIWSMIWCFYLRIPKELILNGLYPSQGIIVGYAMYVTYGAALHPQCLMQLIILIPLLFFNIIFFEALCSVFVKRLNVTPMMLSGLTLGMSWHLAIRKSYSFYTNAVTPSLVAPLTDFATDNITFAGRDWFDVSPYEYGIEIIYGVAMLQFSVSIWSAIPISIGLASASPIMLITTWCGSFVGISTVAFLRPKWDVVSMRLGLYGINSSITSSVLVGNFFLLNFASVVLGIVAVMTAAILNMAVQSFCQPFGINWFALPATIVCIICYMTAGSFPSLIPVNLVDLTVPEDHLRRYYLSKLVIKQFHMSTSLAEYKDLSPQKLQSIEKSMLPVLMCAYAKNGNSKSIKKLLEYGASPNSSDYDGRCPLHIAAAENNQDVVNLLLSWNADVNSKDNYSNTPLSDALKAGNTELAKLIHSKGGKVYLPKTAIASTLCYQVYNEDHDLLEVWLQCGVDCSLRDYDNRTALHIAYSRKNRTAMKILETYSANKELKDRWGNTPMECFGSLVIENPNVAEYMETKFPYQPIRAARIAAKHLDADLISTVLMALLKENRKDEAMEATESTPLLTRADSFDIKPRNLDPVNAALVPSLICALVYMQEHDTLQRLIHLDLDLNVKDYDNRTPLHIATSVGDLESTKLLIWNHADVNALDRFGYSPLFEAVQHKHDNVCKHLRSAGAKLSMTKEMEVSTLCWAVYNNDFDMLTRLVENGADIQAKDYDERSCFSLAEDLENPNMVLHLENLKKRVQKKKKMEKDLSDNRATSPSEISPKLSSRKNSDETKI
ncbi:uncharacterized protein LOC134820564 isoform X2 [Bolinopsis microptera]|uniref:uncharacterized protein LOC134820564 isoform X2 n=1 Tax=Bolinopsis microptera TaxID=2820187 RepID=UPI00307AE49B